MKNDFSKGSIVQNIIKLAVPMTVAQLINVLYSVMDRVYIGMLPKDATLSLTGIGLALPIITLVSAFTNLFGMGGAPLCSIARGKGENEEAEYIMGNSFFLLICTGIVVTIVGLMIKEPLLYLFGASEETFPYANRYISVYLWGSVFVMIGLGMNSFINAQGFAKVGMSTVILGAVLNMILDPIFIFIFKMGVSGAALATIIAQGISAIWVLRFLTGKQCILRLKLSCFKLKKERVKQITGLGLAGFIMAVTNGSVQIVCNTMLSQYGGDLYIGAMTIINTIREVVVMPVQGLTNGAQPVIGYNYGAKEYTRVKKAIQFTSGVCIVYTLVVWGILTAWPQIFIAPFSHEETVIRATVEALRIYFFGFFMMAFQFAGQSVFVALGKSKYAVFFSLLRKAIIVVPLTMWLPTIGNLSYNGVFMAEPISNFIGGIACFVTMYIVVGRVLKSDRQIKQNLQL
ncbi:MAG: MATE family efflux transporter [Cellulosilyticum sp.]|nr:MATE family efflux transporter [Cellulosilyticum sp.]